MRKLSDMTEEQVLDFYVDTMDDFVTIFSDDKVIGKFGKVPTMEFIKELIKAHREEVVRILKCIDDTPITAFNLITRVGNILNDIIESEEFSDFFTFAEQTEQNASTQPSDNSETEN